MKELMIKISKKNLETLHTKKEIAVDVKKYYVSITENIKAYLSDGKFVHGYAMIKNVVTSDLGSRVVLNSFVEYMPCLKIEDFNVRSNKQLIKMSLDVIKVTRRSQFEENLSHFIECSGLSKTSKKAYGVDIRQFLVYLSDYKKNIHDKHIINEYRKYLKKLGLKSDSIQRKMVTIKRFLYFESLNNLEEQICLINKANKKVKIINISNYEIRR